MKSAKYSQVYFITILLMIHPLLAQQGEEPVDSGVRTLAAPTIGIFFENQAFSRPEELRLKALNELEKRGFPTNVSYSCTINVVLKENEPVCYVLLGRGFGKMHHTVTFDFSGKIVSIQSGIAREGGDHLEESVQETVEERNQRYQELGLPVPTSFPTEDFQKERAEKAVEIDPANIGRFLSTTNAPAP